MGQKFETAPVPDDMKAAVAAARERVIEAACDADEALTEKYVAGEKLTPAEIRAALRKSAIALKIVPVLCGSAFKNKGVQPLLTAVVDYLPSPLDVPNPAGFLPD